MSEAECRLVTIGTGSGLAIRERGGPCHLVQTPDTSLVLDCGEGAAAGLRAVGQLLDIDRVILTHLHPDHIGGVLVLLQNSLLESRTKSLDIHLPEEGIAALKALRDAAYLNPARLKFEAFDTNFLPLQAGVLSMEGETRVTVWESDHFARDALLGNTPRPAFGVTVDSGERRLVYTSDVASTQVFEPQLRPDCTLLCEALHIEPEAILDVMERWKLGQVIITHTDPEGVEEVRRILGGKVAVCIAEDGDSYKW